MIRGHTIFTIFWETWCFLLILRMAWLNVENKSWKEQFLRFGQLSTSGIIVGLSNVTTSACDCTGHSCYRQCTIEQILRGGGLLLGVSHQYDVRAGGKYNIAPYCCTVLHP